MIRTDRIRSAGEFPLITLKRRSRPAAFWNPNLAIPVIPPEASFQGHQAHKAYG